MGDAASYEPITVQITEDQPTSRIVDGNLEIDTPDGGVVVQFNPQLKQPGSVEEKIDNFYRNLASEIPEAELLTIAAELHEAVQADDASRQESIANRAKGIDLLGLELEEPKSGDGQTQMDGMSVVTNPLLLDAVLKDWANAQSEFLPADGPCKVEDFATGPEQSQDDLADAFERDMNFYLTSIDTSYGPETSHMLLWGRGFGGCGIKKVYMDPFKKRPTTREVDVKNFIVSDATKDLRSCGRLTEEILMRQSVMKRMMMRGYYIDVSLTPPTPTPNAVDEKIASIQGVSNSKARPEDQPYTLWETQCELDLDQFAPKEYKGKGIELPYLVTMDKDTMQILAIRRDWKPEDEDEECERKRMYVKYPYVPGPGFYGTGLLNILGNSTAAMTAAWRISLDSGMLATFPGFLVAKLAGRQNTSDLVVNPASGTPIETNSMPITDVVMPLPYRAAGQDMLALIQTITEQSKSAGASVEVPVGEGIQNVPVGTMLAHIETATKLMAATHKLGHMAQDEELSLIADLFRENPSAFWKGNKQSKNFWDEAKFIQALDTYTLKPKSDPNVPSHIHRVMRAVALTELQAGPLGALMDPMETLKRVLAAMREDPKGLIKAPPPPSTQPSPEEITAQAKMLTAQNQGKKIEVDASTAQTKAQQEQQAQDADIKGKTIDMAKELIIHKADQQKAGHEQTMDKAKHGLDVGVAAHKAAIDTHQAVLDTAEAMKPEPEPTQTAAKPKKKP
jgi:hypothetical protein